jgi:hypothetical protein
MTILVENHERWGNHRIPDEQLRFGHQPMAALIPGDYKISSEKL